MQNESRKFVYIRNKQGLERVTIVIRVGNNYYAYYIEMEIKM